MKRTLARDRLSHVYVESFGCPTNMSDGEVISGCLLDAGYEIVENPRDADVLIYNTCAVKSPTENRMFHILKKVPKGKRLIVTGCLPLINFERLKTEVDFYGALGPAPGYRIVEVMRKISLGERVVELRDDSKPSLGLPRIRANDVVGVIPINYGCLGACSYCCVLFARGRLRSYETDEVIGRVEEDLASGAKEIWFTSQDTACYGRDIATNLIELLERACRVKGDFLIRVGMMTPNNALEILDGLIQVYKDEKVFKFLHLPVQSGDNKVLKLMNRFYTAEDFRGVIRAFRKEVPEITIATDVICGFPSESREAFGRTMELIKEVQPDIINISKYFSRPHTPAKEMKQLDFNQVKERSKIMARLGKTISLSRNKVWQGWEGTVLIDEKGKGGSWIGRNFAYKPIAVKSNKSLLGNFLRVRVTSVFPTYLVARIS